MSLFGKHLYLPCELLVNNVVQRLYSGQLHHFTILNQDGEATNLPFGNAHLNPFQGIMNNNE